MALNGGHLNYSKELNRMFNDPDRDEHDFWSLLKRYIERCANGQVPHHEIPELTADVLFQIVKYLPKFKPVHGPSSFSRWIAGITKRRGADMRRSYELNPEVGPSELGQINDEGERIEPDITGFIPQPTQEQFDDLIFQDSVQPEITAWIQSMRAGLRGKAVKVFDMWIEGKTSTETAKALGMSKNGVNLHRRNIRLAAASTTQFPLAA